MWPQSPNSTSHLALHLHFSLSGVSGDQVFDLIRGGIPSSGLMPVLPSIMTLALLLFVVAGFFMIPAMVVWLWLSKVTHNVNVMQHVGPKGFAVLNKKV